MTIADVWTAIYPWIVAGLGGFVGAALLLPTKLGEALFSYRLGKALEGYKADQNRELERLKEQLIPFPHQDDLTIYGNDVIDWTSFGLRSI